MLFAVATKDGRTIDQHFGHAERFLIFEVEGDSVELVAERSVERYCQYDPEHPMRTHTLRGTADALAGCRAVVCAMIGEAPKDELERLGIESYVVEGAIVPTLIDLARLL